MVSRSRSYSATTKTAAMDGRCGIPASCTDRFDRFLLILALACSLLVGLGLQARLDHEPSQWCTNTRRSECSVFTIGKAVPSRFNYLPEDLLRRVRYSTEQVAATWG